MLETYLQVTCGARNPTTLTQWMRRVRLLQRHRLPDGFGGANVLLDPRSSSNVLIPQHSMPSLSNKRPRNWKVFEKQRINLYREILPKTNTFTISATVTSITCADGVSHSDPQSGQPLKDDGTNDGFSIVKHITYLNRNLAVSEYLFNTSRWIFEQTSHFYCFYTYRYLIQTPSEFKMIAMLFRSLVISLPYPHPPIKFYLFTLSLFPLFPFVFPAY